VIFYSTSTNKFFQMIGTFDVDTITSHEDRFKNGKLAIIEAKVPRKKMEFTSIDCPA